MGASLSLAFAVHHPERVRTLTMGGHGVPDASRTKLLEELADSLEMGKASAADHRPDSQGPAQANPEQIKLIDAICSRSTCQGLAAVIRGFSGNKDLFLTESRFRRFVRRPWPSSAPTTRSAPASTKLKRLLPKTRVVVIDKADHVSTYTPRGIHQRIAGIPGCE